ncbi:MAG: serine/threonine-protein kinase [Myxococcota bacterium]
MSDEGPGSEPAVSWSLADDAVLAAVKAQVLGAVDDPTRLGKYEIEGPLGAGAMGRILLARDTRLDRKVALKIIAPHLADDEVARARIVREARAMARLSDPHVAQVYEVGEEGDHLFVAMEYVDGQRLGQWLAERARPWAKVVDVFVQAGRGLAATHEKGLVHRDFKPDNVMLERGGRAKVVDFGLVRGLGETEVRDAAAGEVPVTMTATGVWLGTPAYMAPEQWESGTVDARSDQFSFCVALYEALCGQRPFEGETTAQLRRALDERPTPLRARVRVPRRIEHAVMRGLEADPQARWPAMEPLLRSLAPRARARVAVAVPLVALVTAAGMMMVPKSQPCDSAGAPIDGTWNDERRAELVAAMADSEAVWREPTSEVVVQRFDDAAEAWRQAAQAVCAAQEVPDEATECLEHVRVGLGDAVQRLTTAKPSLLVSAASHVELLADARACLQPTSTAWLRDRPSERVHTEAPRARAAQADAIASLGELSIASDSGDYVDALAAGRVSAKTAATLAADAGDRPLVAHAAWLEGRLALRDGDRGGAEAALRRAMEVATEVGEPALRAAAMVDLVYVVGTDRERTAEATSLADEAEATLDALAHAPVWKARLAAHRASTLAHAYPPRADEAAVLHERAVESLRRVLGQTHPDVIVALGNLGAALNNAKRPVEAEAKLEEAIERARRVWGEAHPRTARLRGTLGLSRMTRGDLQGARRDLEQSLRVRADALGQEHPEVASARYNLALVMRQQGDHAAAVEQLRRGLRAREQSRGKDDIGHAEWLFRIGVSELELGRTVDARTSLRRALDLCERWGAGADRYANLRLALARSHVDDDPAKARVLAELARRAWLDDPGELASVDAFLATLPAPQPREPATP